MKIEKELAIVFFISVLAQMSPIYGLSLSVDSDVGGFNEVIQAADNERVEESAIITANSLLDTMAGSGSIKKSFSSNPSAIGSAEVGFEIKNAKSYFYDYYVDPNYVSVSDNLDVTDANKIIAYASARTSRGDSVSASTTVSSASNKGSLHGYSSSAMAWLTSYSSDSYINAKANQGFESASGDMIRINEWAMDAEGDTASSGLVVNDGVLNRYNGGTYAGTSLSSNYEGDWHYEADQASVSHSFYSPSATKIQTSEKATDADGDTASSGMAIIMGSVASYYGVAYSGLTQTYGNGPSSKDNFATAYNDDYGLSGAKIQTNEKATNIMGDTASSQTEITKGSMDSYRGSASTGRYINDYLGQESQYASVGPYISGLTGIKAKIDEKAFSAKGDLASTSSILTIGSLGSYTGYAAAGWHQYGQDQWDGAYARNYHYYVSGKGIDLNAQAVNAEGIKEQKSTKIKNPTNIGYENSAEVNFGVPSVYQEQK